MKDHQPKLFLARAGGSGEDATCALDNGVAIIGYRDFPSLANARDYDTVLALVKQADPDLKPRAAGHYAGQWWAFAIAMQQVARVSAQRAPGASVSGRVSATDRDQKPRARPAALPGLLAGAAASHPRPEQARLRDQRGRRGALHLDGCHVHGGGHQEIMYPGRPRFADLATAIACRQLREAGPVASACRKGVHERCRVVRAHPRAARPRPGYAHGHARTVRDAVSGAAP